MEKKKTFKVYGTKEDPVEIPAGDVLDAIAEGSNIDIEGVTIVGDLDIRKIKDRLEQDNHGKFCIKGNVCIVHSEIREDAFFSFATFKVGADFNDTTFRKNADFRQAKFRGSASFISAVFTGIAYFDVAKFSGNTDFSFAIFCGDTSFRSVTFCRGTNFIFGAGSASYNFHDAQFKKDANFTRANFDDNAYFSHAKFNGDISFSIVKFSGNAYFSGADFCRSANFSEACFGGIAGFGGASFYGNVGFSDASFSKRLGFANVVMKRPASFADVKFQENTTGLELWNKILCPLVRLFTVGKVRKRKKTVTDLWDMNTIVVMDGASNPYLKRYIDDEQWIRSWRERNWWRRIPFFFLWKWSCYCGRNIILWAGWSVFFAVIFAFIYWKFGCDSIAFNVDKLNAVQPDFRAYLYHSVVTFTTLGFGDIVPLTNWARFAVGTEVVFGYVMLGGLISIFANKLARRS